MLELAAESRSLIDCTLLIEKAFKADEIDFETTMKVST